MKLCIKIRVAGTSFREEDVLRCEQNDSIRLEAEPTNEFDVNAIKVLNSSARFREPLHIGYIPAKRTAPFHKFLRMLAAMEVFPNSHGCIEAMGRPHPDAPVGVQLGIRVNLDALGAWFFENFDKETIIDESNSPHPSIVSSETDKAQRPGLTEADKELLDRF